MRIITSVKAMQGLCKTFRRSGVRVGFVPTMGRLHDGHMSLIKKARRQVGPDGKVVASIFVNPTQFGPGEDFTRYPRALKRDKQLCRAAGVDVLFAPSTEEMYPSRGGQTFSTFVLEEHVSGAMEGKSRPTHFRGVATVVAKLFNIVSPDVAVFGEKDFQQASVIRRMTRDLNFPIEICLAPTIREVDGLAMSSRNNYLSPAERTQATCLWQALQQARRTVAAAHRPVFSTRLKAQLIRFIQQRPAARVDYVEFFDPRDLRPVTRVKRGVRMALAVHVGKTRLIDNCVI